MLPQPLAPLDQHKARVLSSIYAPRKLRTRQPKTVPTKMLDNAVKSSLSPFHPLPAIGQKMKKEDTKIIVFDLNKNETYRPGTTEERPPIKLHDILKPLTPLRLQGFTKNSGNRLEDQKPLQLLRENTYDVIEPVYVNIGKVKSREGTFLKNNPTPATNTEDIENRKEKVSPKTRFKNAALQVVKLSSQPETGKLLCLREKQTLNFCINQVDKSICRLQELPQSPVHQLSELSEIFQNLGKKGRQKNKVKKENSWF